jgi:hypothetical protein
MERDFDSSFAGGESDEESSIDAMFSGVSFQSFLAEKTFMPLYGDYAVGDPTLGFPENSTSTMTTPTSFPFTFFSEDFPALKYRNQLGQNSSDEGPRVGQLKSGEDAGKHKLNLKLPKTEPFHFHNEFNTETIQTQTQPFNFLTNPTADLKLSQHFFHLPHLHSLELEHSQAQAYLSASPSKRARVESVTSDPQTLDSIVQSCYYLNRPVVIPQSKLARRRRQKLSEKMQGLQKLMPWDTKMDMSTMLEEAHKYVKYLQAQLKALQSMPPHSSRAFPSAQISYGGVFGYLEQLTRSQILQVLVNSPVTQNVLYSHGFCVFSFEQLRDVDPALQRARIFNP